MTTQPIILIVDDDKILLESIADLLLLSDFQVITAGNGLEALEIIEQDMPDCIVSDVMMPEMDGYALLEALREDERWARIPIVLITAYERPLKQHKRGDLTPDAVLVKPFDVDDLVDAIHNLLD
ncbi:MAG: response regulator [Chloroflexota bacterium]